VCIAYCLWKLLFGYNENIIYLIARQKNADDCISKMQGLMDDLRQEFPFLVPESVSVPLGGRCANKQGRNEVYFSTMNESARRRNVHLSHMR
jgi:hypothetical protein